MFAEQTPPYKIDDSLKTLLGNISSVCLGTLGRLHEVVVLLNKDSSTLAAKGLVPIIQKLTGILHTFTETLNNLDEQKFFSTVSNNINNSLKPLLIALKSHLAQPTPESRNEFEVAYQTMIGHVSSFNRSSIEEFSQTPTSTLKTPSYLADDDKEVISEVVPEFVPTKFCAVSGEPILPGMKFLQYKDKYYLWDNFKCTGSGELIGEKEFIFVNDKFYLRDFYEKSQNLFCAGTGVSLIGIPYVTLDGKNYAETYFRTQFPHVNIRPPPEINN